ncbi:hypothetical protein AB406_0738 [Riemerella anatipestifer]|uniref:Uncharacterized protein n=1 Tax=Riemerella anatipestifer TaxID=34085 RepID=A0A1S7DRI7_RIEAN|nr:hypothetical protein AB406_0738 [Riemerella anatipestifer]
MSDFTLTTSDGYPLAVNFYKPENIGNKRLKQFHLPLKKSNTLCSVGFLF